MKVYVLIIFSDLRITPRSDAQQQYRTAAQLIEGMKSESGSDKILQRADFKQIYDVASRQK
jgi:hypothetical protein